MLVITRYSDATDTESVMFNVLTEGVRLKQKSNISSDLYIATIIIIGTVSYI